MTPSDDWDANNWMEHLKSFRYCVLLWNSTAERENILAWAKDMVPRGKVEIFNLYLERIRTESRYGKIKNGQEPFCVGLCTNDDAMAVQFRLTFPDLDLDLDWDRNKNS